MSSMSCRGLAEGSTRPIRSGVASTAGVAEQAHQQHRALIAVFELLGQFVDELREDVQEHGAVGGGFVERAAHFERGQAAVRHDDFRDGAGELIEPAQQLVAEARGEALARQGQELGDCFDAELAEERGGVGGEAEVMAMGQVDYGFRISDFGLRHVRERAACRAADSAAVRNLPKCASAQAWPTVSATAIARGSRAG